MSFLENIPNIYKRFNETSTKHAIRNMQKIFRCIIKRQDSNIHDQDLYDIRKMMRLITLCDDGLIHENTNETLFGLKAVNYLFWKLINAANEDNTGCNARQFLNFLKLHPNIGQAAFDGVCDDESTIKESQRLRQDGLYAQNCFMKILQNIEKSLSTT